MNKCVGLRAGGAHENTSASSVSPLQLWGTSAGGGGRSLSWSPVAVFPETGSNAGQATLNSSAGFIVSEVDRVRPCASSATPPSLNTRTQLASDMEQTLAARTNPCHAL